MSTATRALERFQCRSRNERIDAASRAQRGRDDRPLGRKLGDWRGAEGIGNAIAHWRGLLADEPERGARIARREVRG